MFMEDITLIGFGFPLMVLLLAVLPVFFAGAGTKIAPGFAVMAVLLAAAFFYAMGVRAADEVPHEIAPAPGEEQLFDAPPR